MVRGAICFAVMWLLAAHSSKSGDIAAAKEIKADTGGGVYAVIDFVGSEASYAFAQVRLSVCSS